MPKISDGVDIHHTSYQSAFRIQNILFQSRHPTAIVHSIPPSHRYCSFHPTIPPLLFIPSCHPTTIVHSILPSHRYCSFHPTAIVHSIPPLLFILSHRFCSFHPAIPPLLFIPSRHPAAIFHSIPPSRRYCSFHPAIPSQWTISSRSRLVKPKLFEFTADGQINSN